VLIIGGGNTAIDAARSAIRDGAEVSVVYRRSEPEMPAIADEVEKAKKEGVDFRFGLAPTHILRDANSVRGITCQPTEPGETDDQGRRQPVSSDAPAVELPCDMVIVAVAQSPDWHGMETLTTTRDRLKTQEDGRVGDRLWAGGDDRGPGIASAAIAQGRIAAEAAHAELRGLPRATSEARKIIDRGSVKTDYFPEQARGLLPRRPEDEWLTHPEAEIDSTLEAGQAFEEATRCMSCGLCMDCQLCFMYCNAHGFARIEKTSPGQYFALALDACEGCGKCIELCPTGYLEPRDD
jgi:ferredoxin